MTGNCCVPTGKPSRLKRYNHKNIFTIPFLMEELEAAIAKMNPKSPWPGCYFWPHGPTLWKSCKKELLEIFNLSWATANCPKSETFHRHSNFETKQECFRVQKL
ncbi:hypothetical protein TNCV_4602191 [Trichonephila clavipes]|nr:hypothetical protein TNCV_4602191 [Trichonephila clavipes]